MRLKSNLNRSIALVMAAAAVTLPLSGCSGGKNGSAQETTVVSVDDVAQSATATAEALPTAAPVVYEAEDGTFTGNVKAENTVTGFTGSGYASGFDDTGDACTFNINIENDGFYDLTFSQKSQGGHKENYVLVDDSEVGVIVVDDSDDGSYTTDSVERNYLTAGAHTVSVSEYWGYICLDSLTVSQSAALPADLYDVPATLVNPNATDNAKRLMSYMTDIYGKKFLSGQYCDNAYGIERSGIWRVTGKYPAVLGLDMTGYSTSSVENGATTQAVENAIDYWNDGGIVTFVWHWTAPSKYLTGTWYSGFRAENTNIDLDKIMNGEDQEGYDLLMADIDAIAVQLKKLADAGVPVLWRPLHEASGGWFWWGAFGADTYKKLYIAMYDRLVNVDGCNNLIWVWNGQNKDWYPGDEYVDIIGEDIYPGNHVYTSQINKFLEAANYTTAKKMVVLSENGCLFDPDLAVRDGAMWGFWCTWSGEFVTKSSKINILSDEYTESSMVEKVYASDYVITADELPDLTTYEIKE